MSNSWPAVTDRGELRGSAGAHSCALGIDIGGSSIKAGLVDLERGRIMGERVVVPTPQPATPETLTNAVHGAAAEVLAQQPGGTSSPESGYEAPLAPPVPAGVAFPGVVKNGIVTFAFNLDDSWLGANIVQTIGAALGRPCVFLNDADAAGIAEMTFGAGRDWHDRTVLMLTLGTGIGSALFTRGRLVPFTELGHVEIGGEDAELSASASAKVRLGMDYPTWAAKLSRYCREMEKLINPDAFIFGGGISQDHADWLHLLDLQTPAVPAAMFNDSGIIGAAVHGADVAESIGR